MDKRQPTLALSRSGGTGISQPSQRRAPRVKLRMKDKEAPVQKQAWRGRGATNKKSQGFPWLLPYVFLRDIKRALLPAALRHPGRATIQSSAGWTTP